MSKLSPLGWTLGAMSLLSIVDDFNWVKLHGYVLKWSTAYSDLTEKLRTLLFGWIDFGPFSVSSVEVHIMVIWTIFVTSYVRAAMRDDPNVEVHVFVSLIFIAPSILLFIALPTPVSAMLSVPFIVLCIYTFMIYEQSIAKKGEATSSAPPAAEVRQEAFGVLGVFALIVLINYSLPFGN